MQRSIDQRSEPAKMEQKSEPTIMDDYHKYISGYLRCVYTSSAEAYIKQYWQESNKIEISRIQCLKDQNSEYNEPLGVIDNGSLPSFGDEYIRYSPENINKIE